MKVLQSTDRFIRQSIVFVRQRPKNLLLFLRNASTQFGKGINGRPNNVAINGQGYYFLCVEVKTGHSAQNVFKK